MHPITNPLSSITNGLVFTPPSEIMLSHERAIETLVRLSELELEHRVDDLQAAILARDVFALAATAENAARVDGVISRLLDERDRAAHVAQLVRRARGVPSFVA